jgi:hypothetical protein
MAALSTALALGVNGSFPSEDLVRSISSKPCSSTAGIAMPISLRTRRARDSGMSNRARQNMFGPDESVPETAGLCLGFDEGTLGPFRESFERRRPGGEPLVSCLFADAKGRADLRPRMSAPAALVNEVTEEGVANLFKITDGP